MSLALTASEETSETFAVFWNVTGGPGATSSGWQFASGIDPARSQLLAVHEAILNATQTLLHCTCDRAAKKTDY